MVNQLQFFIFFDFDFDLGYGRDKEMLGLGCIKYSCFYLCICGKENYVFCYK